MTLGELLKSARREKRFKARELAGYISVQEAEISRYENNHRVPRLEVICKLIRILDLDFEKIMEIYASPEEKNL